MKHKRVVWAAMPSMVWFMATLVACSGDQEPQGEADAGTRPVATDASRDARRDGSVEASAVTAQCQAAVQEETGPTCLGDCLCDKCADVTYACYGDPNCVAIVACANETGCATPTACLQPDKCRDVINAHSAGLAASTAFATCYSASCASACPNVTGDGGDSGRIGADADGGQSNDGADGATDAVDATGTALDAGSSDVSVLDASARSEGGEASVSSEASVSDASSLDGLSVEADVDASDGVADVGAQ